MRATDTPDGSSDLAQVILIKEARPLNMREKVAATSALYPSAYIDPLWKTSAAGSSSEMHARVAPQWSQGSLSLSKREGSAQLKARKVLVSHAHQAHMATE